jgi:hypothetical protein
MGASAFNQALESANDAAVTLAEQFDLTRRGHQVAGERAQQ